MAGVVERTKDRPANDQVRAVCKALRVHYGEHVYAFADRQLGMASGEGLARWLAILRIL